MTVNTPSVTRPVCAADLKQRPSEFPGAAQIVTARRQQTRHGWRSSTMNLTRRVTVGAGVLVSSAGAGAGAGLIIAGLLLTTMIDHARPSLIWELVKLGSQAGAGLGMVVGPLAIFGALRHVPLGRLAASTWLGAIYGGTVGLAISMAFPQPRPASPLILIGTASGFALAAGVLWSRNIRTRHSARVPAAG